MQTLIYTNDAKYVFELYFIQIYIILCTYSQTMYIKEYLSMNAPVVSLSSVSRLRGKINSLRESQQSVYAFLGIPYAVPPVGKLRFKRTQPLTHLWTGERDATQFGELLFLSL